MQKKIKKSFPELPLSVFTLVLLWGKPYLCYDTIKPKKPCP